MTELSVLRLVVLKGRATAEMVAGSLGLDPAVAKQQCDSIAAAGHAKPTAMGLKITPEGKERLAALLDAERAEIDAAAMSALYERFCEHNGTLKEIITAWQVKPGGTPNDHSDASYDAEVIGRLAALHEQALPVADELGGLAPRVAHYSKRLRAARERIAGGDHSYVARPIIDSYHTVWFEMHEELIGLCGLTRAAEAAAGRAH